MGVLLSPMFLHLNPVAHKHNNGRIAHISVRLDLRTFDVNDEDGGASEEYLELFHQVHFHFKQTSGHAL